MRGYPIKRNQKTHEGVITVCLADLPTKSFGHRSINDIYIHTHTGTWEGTVKSSYKTYYTWKGNLHIIQNKIPKNLAIIIDSVSKT